MKDKGWNKDVEKRLTSHFEKQKLKLEETKETKQRKRKAKIFDYMADMGSMKIMTRDSSMFFGNRHGDGIFEAHIVSKKKVPRDAEFMGHFTILTEGWLMKYDCNNKQKQHRFGKGRYFVSLDKDGTTFYIAKQDMCLSG